MASKPDPEVTLIYSPSFANLSVSLSRYRNQWFLTYPRPYGLTIIPGQRIHALLNVVSNGTEDDLKRSRHFFWLNSNSGSDCQPDNLSGNVILGEPFHILLDADIESCKADRPIAAGREVSFALRDKGKVRIGHEIEVLIPEEGLLRQCYYCLAWEAEGPMEHWKPCGDETYWCPDVRFLSSFNHFFNKYVPFFGARNLGGSRSIPHREPIRTNFYVILLRHCFPSPASIFPETMCTSLLSHS